MPCPTVHPFPFLPLPPFGWLARAKNSIRSATKWPFQNRGVSNTHGFHDFRRISRVHNHSTKTKRRENLGRGLKRPVDSPSINPNFLSVPGPRQGEPNRIKERNVENAARAAHRPTTAVKAIGLTATAAAGIWPIATCAPRGGGGGRVKLTTARKLGIKILQEEVNDS